MNKKKYKNERYPIRKVSNIRDIVYNSSELFPDKNAYLVKDLTGGEYRPIKFSQLKADMNSLGTALLQQGLTGRKIAVIGENRYEWIISYLAVCCGVGIIVPLEKELHPGQIKNLLERAGVSAVIYSKKTEEAVREAITGIDGLEYLICMDSDSHEGSVLSLKQLMHEGNKLLDAGNRDFIDAVIDPEAMSMLLFTSGTTGIAKGVMLSHKNIVSNTMNMSMVVNVEGQIGLDVLPMHHTYEMTCLILTGMYQGCCIAICEGLKYILKNMVEARANVMLGVPLLFESMHKKVWKQAEKSGKADKMRKAIAISKKLHLYNTDLPKKIFREIHETLGGGMNTLISGAAAIDPKVIEDFCAMGFNMFQGYGMTECSPIIAVNMDRYSKAASVGLPMPNTEIKIMNPDEDGIGEIICKSDSVMLGYYDDPAETEKVLRDGWLYTGDYGYLDNDGFLYITGRKKNVIVTKNGKNIFPEEVEFYLGKSEYISECLVYGYDEENSGDTVVCADIFPDYEAIEENFGEITEPEIRKILKDAVEQANDQMAQYKRIRRFDIRETEFEKTPTKKIKRHLAGHN